MTPGPISVLASSDLALQRLGDVSGLLIVLAAGVLIFRTFRERYLLCWTIGWLAYLVYRLAETNPDFLSAPDLAALIAPLAFLLAVGFFVAAVIYYTGFRLLIIPLAFLTALALVVAMTLWSSPGSLLLSLTLRGLYTSITLGGALLLIWFSRGRREIGPWLLAGMLVLLHLDAGPGDPHTLAGVDVAIETMLAVGMLLMVLDDSKLRTRRLAAMSAITRAMANSTEHSPILQTAMRELQRLLRAKACWVRGLEGTELVLHDHVGLSEDFVARRRVITASDNYGYRLATEGRAGALRRSEADADTLRSWEKEGLNHVLILPLRGKGGVLGIICVGLAHSRYYSVEEIKFFEATANQIGIAVENLKLVEHTIRSHHQWVTTFDAIEDMVLVHDSDFRVVKMNRALLERIGRTHLDISGYELNEVLPATGRNWRRCPYCENAALGAVDAPDPCFGGFSMYSTSSFQEPDSNLMGTVHVVRDTTQQHAAEEKYKMLFAQVQEGVFISTPDGRLEECNDAFVKMLGYDSRAEVMALDLARDVYASASERSEFRRVIDQQTYLRNYEVTLRRKDGSIITALENSFATRDKEGRVERYQGFLLDITEKKRAEVETQRRNRELNALNAIATIANQSFDLDEILNTSLRHLVELFGADVAAVHLADHKTRTLQRRSGYGHVSHYGTQQAPAKISQEIWEATDGSRDLITEEQLASFSPETRQFIAEEGLRSWVWVMMRAKEKIVGAIALSSRTPNKFSATDRALIATIASQMATTIEKVRLYEETCRAYEDLQRTQEQLLQSEKMSAVGQLVSGVAHELNNPLTAILGYAQLLENESLSERSRDFVQKLFRQAQRTQRLVQNLLSFARQRKPQKLQVDICQVLEDTLALRDYDLKLNAINVEREFAPNLPPVVADSHQMEQVFLNIINNAVDAMLQVGHGGTLRVSVTLQGGQILAEFRDNGPGIKEPNRIFDPFYTTKSVGKGTGLGLSICYGIMKEHGGEVTAYNHAEGGAVLRVVLPAAEKAAKAVEVSKHSYQTNLPLQGRILVVDHEEAVLDFEREVLAGAGADVVAVSSGRDAISRVQREAFDAILVDGSVPGAWGARTIHQWLRDNRPAMVGNIIFTLSHLANPEIRAFLESNNVPWIMKPFEVGDLIGITRRVLKRAKAVPAG